MTAVLRLVSRPLRGLLLLLAFAGVLGAAPLDWPPDRYPDEAGLRARSAGRLEAIARQPYGDRSLAPSSCPDTGLPVRVWEVEGEEIISPYTGRLTLEGRTARYAAISGDHLELHYPPAGLRPEARINGARLHDRPWAGGGHYAGGPLTIGGCVLRLRTAAGGFDLDYRGDAPRWEITDHQTP